MPTRRKDLVGHPASDRRNPEDERITEKEREAQPPDPDGEDPVEQAAADSFPASDPPSFTPSRAGKPDRTSEP
ncbi:MAG: hypothetical protein H7066_14745 [Cytophagaceae bacterium]|nr:hypothetical protein [Gemmatimonadaceae bacterium]